ncbi:MAG TPA: hypothetical protein VGB23_10490, partial [Nitrospirota bacterium]
MANSISLQGSVHPQLTFWHKYDTIDVTDGYHYCDGSGYDDEYDYAKVYLSTYNGQPGTWVQLAYFKGSQTTWAYKQIDLSQWAGLPNVRIMFRMNDNGCDDGNTGHTKAGWTIDDVALEEAPVDVSLGITSSSMNSVSLAWGVNSDSDFTRYEIYRSSTPGVTRTSGLLVSILQQGTVSYTDAVALVQPATYYYRIWVVDQSGNYSMGSNEVQASYTVPLSVFPLTETGESGTAGWSWGSPWGLTDVNPYEGTYSWTDSPGANYAANSNSCLTKFVDLSASQTPVLSFRHHYSLEDGKDFLKLQVSENDGQTWATIRSITGTETLWNLERIDLTPYAGNAGLGVRFCLVSDGQTQKDGWYMDDLKIVEESVQASYPFNDDMESGVIPWFYTSPWGLKTLSALESRASETSTVWTDSPEGSYAAGADTALSLAIDLGSAVMPVLSFWHKYALESNSDYGYVEIRALGSSSWTRQYFVTGTAAAWVGEKIDLSTYAGKQVELRFRLVSDTNGVQSDGWYIDDISIAETAASAIPYPFSDDMEGAATEDNWHMSSWGL